MTKDEKKFFFRVLKENNAYMLFLNNCKKRLQTGKGTIATKCGGSIKMYLNTIDCYHALSSAFTWAATPQRWAFWFGLSEKFSKYCFCRRIKYGENYNPFT